MQFFAASLSLLLLVAASNAYIAAPGKATRLNKFKCKLDDNACLKNYLQNDVIGRFSEGFPEFGVKSFDPWHFQELSFKYDVLPCVELTLDHTDAILSGLAKTKVLDVRTQLSSSSFSADVRLSIPKLLYEGSYTLKAMPMLFPINWSGRFNMSLGDVSYTLMLNADIVKKGGNTFLDLDDLSFDLNVTSFHTYTSGLFGCFEELGDFAVAITNKYWHGFFKTMWKMAEPDVVGTVSNAVSSIFSKTPITEVPSMQLLSSSFDATVD